MSSTELAGSVDDRIEKPSLAVSLGSDSFKQFLDQIPIAVAVSDLRGVEKVVYSNQEFERLSGQLNATVLGEGWEALPGETADGALALGEAITHGRDHLGAFAIRQGDSKMLVDAWSHVIEDDEGIPAFRLVALVAVAGRDGSGRDELEERVRARDTQLLELQHRVKNNLQMIAALIRVEARDVSDRSTGDGFDRLAGRIEALGLLYRALGEPAGRGAIDLGIYLSEIASAVMRAHATEGIHLDLQVDTWLVSLNVAMPAGLVVNELLTNALKHAFQGRDRGVISLHCTTDAAAGCRVLVADDGVGLPLGYSWPKPGKLSALIVKSLLQNAAAQMEVKSAPGLGVQVKIVFDRADGARPS